LFAAILSVLSFSTSGLFALAFGLGVSIGVNAVALVFSIAVVAFLGRKLVARSSATRTFLVVVSALFSVLGVLATLDGVWTFFGAWAIASACSIVMAGCCAMLNVRSFPRTHRNVGTRVLRLGHAGPSARRTSALRHRATFCDLHRIADARRTQRRVSVSGHGACETVVVVGARGAGARQRLLATGARRRALRHQR